MTKARIGDIYQHKNGGKYEVLGVAKNTTNNQSITTIGVVYQSLSNGELYFRDINEFFGNDEDNKQRFVMVDE